MVPCMWSTCRPSGAHGRESPWSSPGKQRTTSGTEFIPCLLKVHASSLYMTQKGTRTVSDAPLCKCNICPSPALRCTSVNVDKKVSIWNSRIQVWIYLAVTLCWTLLCLCRPFCIFERCLDSIQRAAVACRRATNLASNLPYTSRHWYTYSLTILICLVIEWLNFLFYLVSLILRELARSGQHGLKNYTVTSKKVHKNISSTVYFAKVSKTIKSDISVRLFSEAWHLNIDEEWESHFF
jgi:hypothetical protein